VTACRIERAKQYLVEGSLPIGAISRLTGFSSSQQFATVFRRVTGLAPAQYRRARR
jgi:AraC-like DNA-binding protein